MRARAACRFLAGALALIATAGCGGGTSPPSKKLRAQATRICSAANLNSSRIATPTWKAGAGMFLKRGIRVLSPELGQLRRLNAAGDDADIYAAALNAVSGELTALRATAAAIDLGENPAIAFKALQRRLTPLEAQANDAWGALQIPACAG